MSRSLANSLYERLLRTFPADRAYSKADWDEDKMPAPVRHFLVQLLRHHSNREARRLRRARTEWVDYNHPEMERAVRTFFSAVENHIRVPRDQWKNTLQEATQQTTAHLIRPVDVLTDFVYGQRTTPLPLQQVLWRMKFFGPFAYHRDAIRAFAKKQELDALEPDQFERVLRRVDERITTDFDPDRWLQLLDALFLTARRATGQERVETRLLRSFFAEKEASRIVQRLTAYEEEGYDVIGPQALYRLIEEAQASSPDQDAAAPSRRPSSTPEPRLPEEPSEPPSSAAPSPEPRPERPSDDDIWGVAGSARPVNSNTEPAVSEETGEETPLWKQFQQGGADGSVPPTDASEPEHSQQPLWAQFRQSQSTASLYQEASAPGGSGEETPSKTSATAPGGSRNASTPNVDLSTLEQEVLGTSNPPHRAVYIRQLFNGNETDYRRVLGRLRSAESWGKASQILASDVFRAHKVNIYSDAAVHFTNAIESRYRN